MNTKQILFEHYNGVVDSSEAVSRLRKFILDLAVRGRLVEQDLNDEPADELLQRISREKQKLIESGEFRKQEFSPDHIFKPLYQVPDNWKWVRLCQIGGIVGGGTPRTSEPDYFASPGSGVAWITPADLGKLTDLYVDRGNRDISDSGLSSSSARLVPTGSILFSCRAPIGYVAISSNPVSTNQGIKTLVPYISRLSKYVAYVLSHFAVDIDASAPGTTYKEISGKLFARVLVPLPPLAEQHRIVAKVDVLMDQCDRLEEKFKEREDHRKRFTKASFGSLTKSGIDEIEITKRGGFVIKNFDRLTVDVDQIESLRQTILDLAVRGRLVEQDPKEEPAAELLDRIRKEKQLLTESGAIKIQKPLAALDKLPFDLPSSWKWKRLGEIAEIVRGVSFPASAKSNTPGVDLLPCLRSGNIQRGVVWKELIYVPNTVVKDSSKFVRECDVLISIANSYELVGKCAIVHSVPLQATFGAFLAAIRLHVVSPKFASIFLMSTYSSTAFRIGSSQTTNIANITFSTIRSHPFPIPPLGEQQRIVAKVDELIGQCAKLERKLHKTVTVRKLSLESCINEVSQPTFL